MATTTITKSPAPVFDYNTGKALAPGQAQSLYNTQTGQKIGSPANTVASTNPSANQTQSTTTLSSQNKINAAPGIQNTTTNLGNTGIKSNTDANGNVTSTYADGSVVPAPSDTKPTAPKTDASGVTSTGGYFNSNYYAPGSTVPEGVTLTASDPVVDSAVSQLNSLRASSDSFTSSMIGNIQAQFSSLIQQQQQTNTASEGQMQNALLMGGATGQGSSAQYAPVSSTGIMTSLISYGTQQIADLNTKEQTAILQAQQAGLNNDIQLQDKMNTIAMDIRTEKQNAVVKLQNDIAAAKKDAEAQAQLQIENNLNSDKFTYSQKQDAIDNAFKQGQLSEDKRHNLATELAATQAATGGSGLNGTMTSVPMTSAGTPNATAQAQFLASLPANIAVNVKGIAEYDINPSSFSTSKKQSQGGLTQGDLISLAKQYDPSYSESEYAARAAYKKSLAGVGPSTIGGAINSANKAVNHLTAFVQDMSKTSNTASSKLNAVLNPTVGQLIPGLNKTIRAAKTEGLGVSDELAKFFKGSGATDVQSIKDWQDQLSTSASPSDIRGLTQGALTLLSGQLETLSEQYARTMGKAPDNNFIGPSAKANLENLKNQGYTINVPGIYYSDKNSYLKNGGSTDALSKARDLLVSMNDPNNPATPENILELAQIQ